MHLHSFLSSLFAILSFYVIFGLFHFGYEEDLVIAQTFNSAAEYCAYLYKIFHISPCRNIIVSHTEGYKLDIANNQKYPESLWNLLYSIGTNLNIIEPISVNRISIPDPIPVPRPIIYGIEINTQAIVYKNVL